MLFSKATKLCFVYLFKVFKGIKMTIIIKKSLKVILMIVFSIILTGCSDGVPEIHHVFPQQFRLTFEKAGIDIDKYGLEVTRDVHRTGAEALHKIGWNIEWKRFFEKTPNATKQQMMDEMKKILKKTGFEGVVEFKNYRTKVSESIETLTNNHFLELATWVGEGMITLIGGTSIGSSLLSFFAFVGSSIFGYLGIKTGYSTNVGFGVIILVISVLGMVGVGYITWYVLLVSTPL